ncbi:MAG: 2-hydroxychromene-2-carboxylate isomerase [Alphaproteobacteria bacterium]|jgi:2-hydroxychromene-2-carboxylate isomerase|nr:2-hydroxychromene-2-carboxylate isomerase [Alphaproteobacteria bacterium]
MAEIEYFYSAHSAFAYLGSARFMEIARAAGREIVHRPVDLGRVVPAAAASGFTERTPNHRAYYFGREIERWSEERDAPVMPGMPTHHRKDMTLANGLLIAAMAQGQNVDRLAHCMLEEHWRDDADLADEETLARLCRSVEIAPEPVLEAALSPEVRAQYDANTEEAIRRSVFGSPTYFVDGDMFYGQDRLEMVERALRRAYAGEWPRAGDGRRTEQS